MASQIMANTATLTPPQNTRPELKPNQVLGRIDDTFENLYETLMGSGPGWTSETPVAQPSFEASEPIKTPVPELVTKEFPSTGSFENFGQSREAPKTEIQSIAESRAVLAEVTTRHKISHDEFVLNEEVRLGVEGMSDDERNGRLHLNLSLKRENTNDAYHIAELYKQRKNELAGIETQQKAAAIPSPARRDLSMNLEDIEGNSSVSAGAAASGKVG